MQIAILGAHRSGTSALTRLTNMMGCYIGGEGSTIGFNDENPKGFWERRDVIEANDALLHHFDCRWDDLLNWPQDSASAALPQMLSDRIKSIVLELDHHRPWAIKDPRLCQTFGLWRSHLEMPAAIIAWRDPHEVAMSLHKRNGFTLLHGLALWEHAMIGALQSSEGLPRIVVSHRDLLQQPAQVVRTIYDWATAQQIPGLRLPTDEEISQFIDPALQRSKTADEGLPPLTDTQQALLVCLQQGRLENYPTALSVISQEALHMAHQQRVLTENLRHAEAASDAARDQAQQLRQTIEGLQQRWQLSELEWKLACDRFAAIEQTVADTQQALSARIDLLGDPGRIRRRLSKLFAAIGG